MALNGGEAEQMLEAAQQHPDQACTHSCYVFPLDVIAAQWPVCLHRHAVKQHTCNTSQLHPVFYDALSAWSESCLPSGAAQKLALQPT